MMNYYAFLRRVKTLAHIESEDEASRAAHATLTTLGERLSDADRRQLAKLLPHEIRHYIEEGEAGEKFTFDGFLNRVSEREHKDLPVAHRHARAVCGALGESLPEDEVVHIKETLPANFAKLFEVTQKPPSRNPALFPKQGGPDAASGPEPPGPIG